METLWDHVRHSDDQSPFAGARVAAFGPPSCSAPDRPRLRGPAPLFPAESPRLRTVSSALPASRALPRARAGTAWEAAAKCEPEEEGAGPARRPGTAGAGAAGDAPERKREVKAPGCGFLSDWAC